MYILLVTNTNVNVHINGIVIAKANFSAVLEVIGS